jgi:hypothetical protein
MKGISMTSITNKDITLGINHANSQEALSLCLSSVLLSKRLPGYINILCQREYPTGGFYLEQLISLARIYGVLINISFASRVGLAKAMGWQLANRFTPYLWLLDDDVIVNPDCLATFENGLKNLKPEVAFLQGPKADVNNRRGYKDFSNTVHHYPEEGKPFHIHHGYSENYSNPCTLIDGGNVLLITPQLDGADKFLRELWKNNSPAPDTMLAAWIHDKGFEGRLYPNAQSYHLEKPTGDLPFRELPMRAELVMQACKQFSERTQREFETLTKHWK